MVAMKSPSGMKKALPIGTLVFQQWHPAV